MPVQVARYLHEGETSWGVVHGRHIAPLPGRYASTAEFVTDWHRHAWRSTSDASPAFARRRDLAATHHR